MAEYTARAPFEKPSPTAHRGRIFSVVVLILIAIPCTTIGCKKKSRGRYAGIDLPKVQYTLPLGPSLNVTVTRKAIRLNKKNVVTLKGGSVKAEDKRSGKDGALIIELYHALKTFFKASAKKDIKTSTMDIAVAADRTVRFEVLDDVLYTIQRAGYGKIRLAARDRHGKIGAIRFEYPGYGKETVDDNHIRLSRPRFIPCDRSRRRDLEVLRFDYPLNSTAEYVRLVKPALLDAMRRATPPPKSKAGPATPKSTTPTPGTPKSANTKPTNAKPANPKTVIPKPASPRPIPRSPGLQLLCPQKGLNCWGIGSVWAVGIRFAVDKKGRVAAVSFQGEHRRMVCRCLAPWVMNWRFDPRIVKPRTYGVVLAGKDNPNVPKDKKQIRAMLPPVKSVKSLNEYQDNCPLDMTVVMRAEGFYPFSAQGTECRGGHSLAKRRACFPTPSRGRFTNTLFKKFTHYLWRIYYRRSFNKPSDQHRLFLVAGPEVQYQHVVQALESFRSVPTDAKDPPSPKNLSKDGCRLVYEKEAQEWTFAREEDKKACMYSHPVLGRWR